MREDFTKRKKGKETFIVVPFNLDLTILKTEFASKAP